MRFPWQRRSRAIAPSGLGLLQLTKLGYDLGRGYETLLSEPLPERISTLLEQMDERDAKLVPYFRPTSA